MAGKKYCKARPQIYIADAGYMKRCADGHSLLTDSVEMGKIVETAVYK